MPANLVHEPVEVLLELPGDTRLADPGDPDDRDQPRLPLFRRCVEEILDQAQLSLAADERRLEAAAPPLAASRRDHPHGAPERQGLGLPLQLVCARVLVGDRRLARAPGALADEHRARLRGRLHARGGIDEVARDHALALRTDGDGGLAGDHAGAQSEPRCADVGAERPDHLDQLERRAHRPLGVVLARDGRPPDRHHRVADELLDRPAVALDHLPRGVEVAREELAHLLRVTILRQRREADEVGEEDGDEPPLGFGGRRGRRLRVERAAALAAEAVVGVVRRAAGRTAASQRRAAARAEPSPGPVVGSTAWTRHQDPRASEPIHAYGMSQAAGAATLPGNQNEYRRRLASLPFVREW